MTKTKTTEFIRIALDVAEDIASGALPQGEEILPEKLDPDAPRAAIGRALRLLKDMDVVRFDDNRACFPLAQDNAKRYVEYFHEDAEARKMFLKLQDLMVRQDAINREIDSTIKEIFKARLNVNRIPSHEFTVSEDSFMADRTLGGIEFRTHTGATIVALMYDDMMIASPGPDAILYPGTRVLYIGDANAVEKVNAFLKK